MHEVATFDDKTNSVECIARILRGNGSTITSTISENGEVCELDLKAVPKKDAPYCVSSQKLEPKFKLLDALTLVNFAKTIVIEEEKIKYNEAIECINFAERYVLDAHRVLQSFKFKTSRER
ncbi:MAG: hypothetical protein GY804_14650 [Alphaproteobacteria bacterium]|nr:hypothetical protein [Alphaproteobacteria bacterium]